MNFILDKQTQNDLNLFSSRGKQSIYGLFNRTRTKGGEALLEDMFKNPLSNGLLLEKRLAVIKFFSNPGIKFLFDTESIDLVEQYLTNTDSRTLLSAEGHTIENTVKNIIGGDTEKNLILKGIKAVLKLYSEVNLFLKQIQGAIDLSAFHEEYLELLSLVKPEVNAGKLTFGEFVAYDQRFRFSHRNKIKKLLFYIYSIDIFITVGKVAIEKGYTFPAIMNNGQRKLVITGLYHPLIKDAVANNLMMDPDGNVLFLTGANMAGKSTFMKSFGVAIFLAHIGFPIPAVKMEFSILDGLYTTINLPDNLNSGYSHFYAEVMRVKIIAEQLRLGKKLLVVFDELFRGTNVKDAYDATVAISGSMARRKNCFFLVSTHIMEAAEKLNSFHNIKFVYLPTRLVDNLPVYSYQLEKGVSDDRHGMLIIQKEGILEILKSAHLKQDNE
jgi:DNA mismatch repair protein MutS